MPAARERYGTGEAAWAGVRCALHLAAEQAETDVERRISAAHLSEVTPMSDGAEMNAQRRPRAAYRLDHLFAQFHWRWERLRVAPVDVTEVDVEERACIVDGRGEPKRARKGSENGW